MTGRFRQRLSDGLDRLELDARARLGSAIAAHPGSRLLHGVTRASGVVVRGRHAMVLRELQQARALSPAGRPRMLATACWDFPIYSQTFVYREVHELLAAGFDGRFVYSQLNARDQLPDSFASLWDDKACLHLHPSVYGPDIRYFRKRMPERVAQLTAMVGHAAGMSEAALFKNDNFRQAFSFARMAEAYGVSYLHSYFFYDRSLMALVAAYLLQVPRGISCYADHMLEDHPFKLVPLHVRLCDVVVATSRRIKSELLSLVPDADPDRILVKPNAIDAERYLPRERELAPGQPLRLVCVNRIEPKKGLSVLVDAVAQLEARGVDVVVDVVGEVDRNSPASIACGQALNAQIAAHGLHGRFRLLGRKGETGVREALESAHLFVAPYVESKNGDKDGVPTALLEAMASGLPSVTTDAGSILEVVTSGIHGLVVPEGDADGLATAIAEMYSNSAMRERMGQAAVARVRDHFDVRVCEGPFHARVQQLVAKAAQRRGPVTAS